MTGPEVPSTRRLVGYFLHLGATGFGGPIALAAAMQRDLVDDRRWITKQEYADGLALAQLAPGPLAAQLAMYLGYVRAGMAGATLTAVAFVLPSLSIVWLLSVLYVRLGGLEWIHAAFYGIGAAVITMIGRAAVRLARSTLASDPVAWAIFAVTAVTTAIVEREIVWLFVVAGGFTWANRARAATPTASTLALLTVALPVTAAPAAATLPALFWFFAKAGAFVFGSGLAIVPFLYGGLVQERGWLNDREFLDAVAIAMITPGPVVITVAFIGYLVAGSRGLLVSAAAVFLPVYLFVVVPAPYFRRHRDRDGVKAFVHGVTAAASGAIAGAAIVLARRAIVDRWTFAIALGAWALLATRRIPEPVVMLAAGLAGLSFQP